MALIQTIDEIKEALPKLVSNLNAQEQLPNFDAAEIKYLVPIIGMEQYEELQAAYDANTLSTQQASLLKHVQLFVATNAFRDEMIINNVMWTDQGIRTLATSEMDRVARWQFEELKSFFIDRSADGEEILLTYLWGAKASFPAWTASEEYKNFSALLIKSGTDFKKQYPTVYQPMRTYYQLQPVVKECQEKYLEEGVGRKLLNYLVAAAPTEDEQYCIDQLKKALAYFTIKEACIKLPIRISDAGLTVSSQYGDKESADGAGREGASPAAIEILMRSCEEEGQNFLSKARHELWKYYKGGSASAGYTTAFEASVLMGYIAPEDRTFGNEDRHFFAFG